MHKNEVAALVILYNFNNDVIENIKTYANDIGKVYAFDNSEDKEKQNIELLKTIENVEYIDGLGNIGLPIAINRVAKLAQKEGYRWLYTFDQDSRACEGMVERMIEFLDRFDASDSLGILAPIIKDGKLDFGVPATEYSFYDKVIQSGALHNLLIFEKVKGYDEKLFIDQVDFEYCVRMILEGYRIIKLNTALLEHNVKDDEATIKYVNGKKVTYNKYNSYRYYYIIRNNLYCEKKFKGKNKLQCAENRRCREVLWRALPKEKNKKVLWAMLLGYVDFLLGRMGKCCYDFDLR